ncbi:F-box protein At3g07870-like [Cornus florida]|uniref:F-box protein At3g07870-like n=1 Tax=Cornus florida TaxID=4283 RepID=UPI00289C6848|nr:F-box protein At3g07870-like [Cornus florida]
MSDFLPRDVLIDVLARLPIKTLVRCACVCKSWYSLLTNPSFITTHLNRSSVAHNNNNNLLLVRRFSSDDDEEEHYSLLRCEKEMLFCDYAELDLPLKNDGGNPYLRVIGCCNGVLCLSDDLITYMDKLYLWNPSIQKTMTLPPLRVTYQSHGPFMHSIGFGFDSLTDDYKVVRIVYLHGPDGFEAPPEVDIFSVSTGTWRNISHLGLPYTILERASQAYVNGAAHWIAYDTERRSNFFYLIVSFHMGDKVFGEIMVPDSMEDANWMLGVHIAKVQESLSLIHIQLIGIQVTCCIWVMKEYGISESWTKQFNIDMSEGLFKSVTGFTRKGEVLFGTKAGYLVAYDPEANRAVPLHIHGSTDSWYRDSLYSDAYTESLVLFGVIFHDTVTCKESPVLHGKVSGAKKSRKRRGKTKKKGKEQGSDQGAKSNEEAREGVELLFE